MRSSVVAAIGAAAVLTTALAGCSSSGAPVTHDVTSRGVSTSVSAPSVPVGTSTTSGPATARSSAAAALGRTALCAQLQQASQAFGEIAQAKTNPATAKEAFARAIKVYQAIGNGAPANVKSATQEMTTLMQQAEKIYSGGSVDPSSVAGLSALSAKAGQDISVITTYLESNCT